jgi:hypothetical protein
VTTKDYPNTIPLNFFVGEQCIFAQLTNDADRAPFLSRGPCSQQFCSQLFSQHYSSQQLLLVSQIPPEQVISAFPCPTSPGLPRHTSRGGGQHRYLWASHLASHGSCETYSQVISQVGLAALSRGCRVPRSRATFEIVLANWKANQQTACIPTLFRKLHFHVES